MKQGEVLFLLGSACVVVFAWIAFSIVHNSLTSTITGTVIQAISSIQQNFDTQTITAMKNKTVVVPLYTIQSPSQQSIVVSSTPDQTQLASSSALTQGGALP